MKHGLNPMKLSEVEYERSAASSHFSHMDDASESGEAFLLHEPTITRRYLQGLRESTFAAAVTQEVEYDDTFLQHVQVQHKALGWRSPVPRLPWIRNR